MVDSTQHLNQPSIPVPLELVRALKGEPYSKNLGLYFFTNGLHKQYPLDKIINVTNPELKSINGQQCFHYCESYGWFHIFYLYQTFESQREKKEIFKQYKNFWFGKNPKISINDY